MSFTKISAEQIAEHQLIAAIKLLREKDYLSSLTLAGAAEEILGKRLCKLGQQPSFDQLSNLIVAVSREEGETDANLEKTIGDLLNSTRNELKHYAGDEPLEFDLRSDCLEMLERAIANHEALTGILLSEAMYVWKDRCDV
ncbi:hypothetical protein CSC70_10165 [Pseudoxanthomonas kalamensis DSM 18571]|uniref:hypothetical protein n=1 Tax=Pseudoxanthomonas kalamensis TaxID=289483 RepID=UPI001391CE4E|nr:hypothetical protein [Pseudoxanthomonas kalamensis]KAF1710025.1 hypothetical protein CSC70_10165 [Pseudoxanthomonas kalamensis DSM 18571]